MLNNSDDEQIRSDDNFDDSFCRAAADARSVLLLEELDDADFITDWFSGDHGGLKSGL